MTSYGIWAIMKGDGSPTDYETHTGDLAKARRMAIGILQTEPVGYFGKEYVSTEGHPIPPDAKIATVFASRVSGDVVLHKGKFYWFTKRDDRRKWVTAWQFQELHEDGKPGKVVRKGVYEWPAKKDTKSRRR